MEIDRHASEGNDRSGEDATAAPQEAYQATPQDGPEASGEEAPAHEYGYDETPATDLRSATAQRKLTAPRAVLRPVPEGFPTPPPRPARPNRRPAPQGGPGSVPARPRGLLIAGISVAAVLALVVAIGGVLLVVRSLAPAESEVADPAAPASEAPADPAQSGQAQLGEVALTEVSTEVGVRSVGTRPAPIEPEGEFIVVAFEAENQDSDALEITQNVTLETADGTHEPDGEATGAYTADSRAYGLVEPGETEAFHAVFDVPIGTRPTALHFNLSSIGEAGTLPLSP